MQNEFERFVRSRYHYDFKRNKRILEFPTDHPARRFFYYFLECKLDCVGREIEWLNQPEEIRDQAIDQDWHSEWDGRDWKFSSFAYAYISCTVVLDGWIHSCKEPTKRELEAMKNLPMIRGMMNECAQAAERDNNLAILELVAMIQQLADLWEECIRTRWELIGYEA